MEGTSSTESDKPSSEETVLEAVGLRGGVSGEAEIEDDSDGLSTAAAPFASTTLKYTFKCMRWLEDLRLPVQG